jgi:flagellar basal-body rod modification protein FlgD
MGTSVPQVGTNTTGQAEQGTSGTSINNNSSTTISTNEFLDLMLDSLQDQDPLNPSSSDPTQYLTELAQMTGVEQETDTAQNTSSAAQEESVSQAVGLIGDSVTYQNQTTGASITGTVNSVQITSTGPTLTVDGVAGISMGTISNVTAAGSGDSSGDSATSGSDSGSTSGSGS